MVGRKYLAALCAAAIAVWEICAFPAFGSTLKLSDAEASWVARNQEIAVYGRGSVSPFIFPSKPGDEPRGLSIDYVKAALAKFGVTARFVRPMSLKEAQDRLERFDGVDLIPLAAVTPENRK